ncbi:MnmA/TRMU family protein, partial [candidate division WOR-3 bacterium]|nr:MnmA/TRMU family protein [candidate division WOR-3 bacterium]
MKTGHDGRPRATAVALMSGGLDSMLAVKLILEQGIEVIGVNFAGGYCPKPHAEPGNAERAAAQLGIEMVELPIDEGFIELVKAPRYGHGRNLNPCIDC